MDKEKQFNETYQTITRILQNRKKLTDEKNTGFRTAKPLQNYTFVLLTNQQQVEGERFLLLKTGPYLIIEKTTDTTYILQDQNKDRITIHRNHIETYYPKEKHIKEELQNYLLDNHVPMLKQPNKTILKSTETNNKFIDQNLENKNSKNTTPYNLRERNVKIQKY